MSLALPGPSRRERRCAQQAYLSKQLSISTLHFSRMTSRSYQSPALLPPQCVAKHVLDAIKGDITTVLGAFSAWSFPAVVVWEDLWFSWRTFVIIFSMIWCGPAPTRGRGAGKSAMWTALKRLLFNAPPQVELPAPAAHHGHHHRLVSPAS